MHLFFIALGGAMGALSRYGLQEFIAKYAGKDFPFGTMIANILGALLIGACYVLIVEKSVLPEYLRALLMTGFLGALTTFSTFSLDAFNLIESAHYGWALLYVLGSVLLCLIVTFVSVFLTRQLF